MAAQSTPRQPAADPPIRIGVSSCLLGESVRYDGGHKRNVFLTDVLAQYIEWAPVCPELEMGLGVPRESIQLERSGNLIQLVGTKSRTDHTTAMNQWSKRRLSELAQKDLCGYILKKDSPSCGLERVRVYDHNGVPSRNGRGLFAEALISRFGNLPVEEEGRLQDPKLRENFIERVFAYRRLRTLFAARWSAGAMVDFHTRHKLLLMAHSPAAYRELGRLVAAVRKTPRKAFEREYASRFMEGMRAIATRGRHTNVLQHMLGYLRKQLDKESIQEVSGLIEDYRQGLVPLIVPITLVRHYVRLFKIEYLSGQLYLDPHPKELMLRNHV
jgi:uncharacterized protein YbgA (DUF1722 family)/uncharacterized protein YbbK (DUF523 family)